MMNRVGRSGCRGCQRADSASVNSPGCRRSNRCCEGPGYAFVGAGVGAHRSPCRCGPRCDAQCADDVSAAAEAIVWASTAYCAIVQMLITRTQKAVIAVRLQSFSQLDLRSSMAMEVSNGPTVGG